MIFQAQQKETLQQTPLLLFYAVDTIPSNF